MKIKFKKNDEGISGDMMGRIVFYPWGILLKEEKKNLSIEKYEYVIAREIHYLPSVQPQSLF